MRQNGRVAARETQTFREIANQPASWQQTLDSSDPVVAQLARLAESEPEAELLAVGCGSSLYMAQAGAGLWQELTGRPARAVPASDLLLAPGTVLARGRRYLGVGLSRSGETSETVAAVRRLREAGHTTVGITTRPETALPRTAGYAAVLAHAADRSICMTQSCTNMLLLLLLWASALAGRADVRQELEELPAAAGAGLEQWEAAARQLGEDLSRRQFVFFGSGSYYGLAREASLKMKEMSQEPSEAWQTLEFRHGPISAVTEQWTAVLLTSRRSARHEADVLADLSRMGAQTVAVGEGVGGLRSGLAIELGTGLGDWAGAPLHLIPLQFLALYRALAVGRHPDHPRALGTVVKLDRLGGKGPV